MNSYLNTKNTKLNNIYCITKKGETELIATYNPIEDKLILSSTIYLESIKNITTQISNWFIQDHTADQYIKIMLQADDITVYFGRILRWRQCTALICLQLSDVSFRILIYMYDKIKHSGQGTNCDLALKIIMNKDYMNNLITTSLKYIFDTYDTINYSKYPLLNSIYQKYLYSKDINKNIIDSLIYILLL